MLLPNAHTNSFSVPARSTPGCCHHRMQLTHDHSSTRPPQLIRLTHSRKARGHACARAIECRAGQLQSSLQFYCYSSSWSQSKILQHRNLKSWVCLCCRAMGNSPISDGRMMRCLRDCQPRTSCTNLMLRRWIVRHTQRQHRCMNHTPLGGCQQCQPCMMLLALHLHRQPCGNGACHLEQLPACCGRPVHSTASTSIVLMPCSGCCAGPIWQHDRCTCHSATLALPDFQPSTSHTVQPDSALPRSQ